MGLFEQPQLQGQEPGLDTSGLGYMGGVGGMGALKTIASLYSGGLFGLAAKKLAGRGGAQQPATAGTPPQAGESLDLSQL